MPDKEKSPASNDNAGTNGQMVLERIRVVQSGINKMDLDTVRLRINDHNFCIDFIEFVEVLDVLARNCEDFQTTRMRGPQGAKH